MNSIDHKIMQHWVEQITDGLGLLSAWLFVVSFLLGIIIVLLVLINKKLGQHNKRGKW